MNGMSPEATQLVNAGRQSFCPTQADRTRLMAAITGTATLSVGVAIAAGAQRSFRGIFGGAHAALVLAVALPVAAAGAAWLHTSGQSPAVLQPARPVTQPPAAVAQMTTEPPVPVIESQAEGRPPEPSTPVSPARSEAPVGEPSKPGREIRQEVALLSKAQAALSRGRPQAALEALAEHAQRFPRGVLTEERVATRARALCALGRTREAATELKRMETLNPSSAYLARARESCGL